MNNINLSKMKKFIKIRIQFLYLIVFMMLLSAISGCGAFSETQTDGDKITIVTTIFPIYDWVREITDGSENVEITLLLDNGTDLHSFQPTADDLIQIADCDMFLYVGGESDIWVEDALANAANQDMVVISLLDALGDQAKEEEIVEGMEAEHEDGHDHDAHAEEEDPAGEDAHAEVVDPAGEDAHAEEADPAGEDAPEYDEHVWLSLKNADYYCGLIAEKLSILDEENSELYAANAQQYRQQLLSLDQEFQAVVDASPIKTILLGDRFPFRYLTEDYGLDYYAAFSGCSADSEASFETITFLAGKVDELDLHTILILESNDGKIAQKIRETTTTKNQQILTMDSLQSVSAEDVANGVTYLSLMKENCRVLQQALQ